MLYKVSFSASGSQLIVPITFEHCSLPLPTIPSEINSFTGNGLIDTGATHTAIVETILINLGMIPIGKVIVGTPSDQSVVCNQYMIKLTFPDTKQFIDNFRVTAMIAPIVTSHYPVHCLIGMGILRFGRFAYNGENDTFELVFR